MRATREAAKAMPVPEFPEGFDRVAFEGCARVDGMSFNNKIVFSGTRFAGLAPGPRLIYPG